MKVNFNNLRKQAVIAANTLSEKLSDAILKESQYAKPNDVYHDSDIDIEGYVLIDKETIEEDMNNLLRLVNFIAITFDEDNSEFKDMTPEIPETPSWFNHEEE